MTEKPTCGECGADLPANAPQGLCPRCLANMGLGLLQTAIIPGSDFQAERTGTMIGRYKLLEKIGEGGFGVVYMAEQVEPVQRKVALKIIKAGMDTKEVIARFEAERQAIALMDHPNIARALDAGATAAGRPYFVMELVRGIPITDYCDQNNLSTRERLQLFMKVCQAVQHAHQKGVIHRDIKPSNVLVTLHDGEPVPKVIDFGVAKALGQKLTEKTVFTGFQHMIGTPAYMSPEQAALSGLDIDTRADIYSLGVLLYELLTGVTPFDSETLRKAAMDEVRRMIRETEPLKPSTRLQTLGEKLTDIAKHRGALPAALSRLLRGDLDWIVMKCLEKDRRRRYETANGLAADVARHLDCEPVVARPPGTLYLLQKRVRKNMVAYASATAIVVALLAGFVISSEYAVKATRAEKRAAAEAKKNRETLTFLVRLLAGRTSVVDKDGTKVIVSESDSKLLSRDDLGFAAAMFQEVLAFQKEKFGSDSMEAARTLGNLAELYKKQAQLKAAEATRRAEVAIRATHHDNSPEAANALHDLARLIELRGDKAGAVALHKEAIEMTAQSKGTNELEATVYRGNAYASFGLLAEAATNLTKAIELQPTEHVHYYLLSVVLVKLGDIAGYERLCPVMLEKFGQGQGPVWVGERIGKACALTGNARADLEAANKLVTKALECPGQASADLPYYEFAKALVEYRQGRHEAAVDWARKSFVPRRASWGKEFDSSRGVMTYAVEAMALSQLKRSAEAQQAFNEALQIMERDAPRGWAEPKGTTVIDWLTCDVLLKEARTLIEPAIK